MTLAPRKSLVLHACCGPCLTHCALSLRKEGKEPLVFFSNSNIWPPDEYARRLESARKFADAEGFEFVADAYNHEAWEKDTADFKDEPEGGKRCLLCFRFNLIRTARFALSQRGASLPTCDIEFTTTLTVSPKKNSAMVAEAAAAAIAATAAAAEPNAPCNTLKYLPYDFKKGGGFAESVKLSAKYGLYRQNYCGCGLGGETRQKNN